MSNTESDEALPEKQKLDELDEQIVWELIRDGRISFSKLAARLKVAVSTVSTRVSAMRRSGVIRSVHAEVDYRALGFPVQAMIFVRLKVQSQANRESFAHKIALLPSLLNLYYLGSSDDFLIHILATSPDQLQEIVSSQVSSSELVASARTHVILDYVIGHRYMHLMQGFDDVRRLSSPAGSGSRTLWPKA